MFNAVLADQTLAEIERDQTKWHQGAWVKPVVDTYDEEVQAYANAGRKDNAFEPITACGAKLCFAGHAVLVAGYHLTRDTFFTNEVVDPSTGLTYQISDAAAKELGLTEGTVLFEASNELDQLRDVIDVFRNGGSESDAFDVVFPDEGYDCDCPDCW